MLENILLDTDSVPHLSTEQVFWESRVINQAKKVLKDIYGYKKFRPMQEEIIQSILNQQDTLVIMPTGGGKSLCYQIPAQLMPGLTIVVSPLISLMQDQVSQLKEVGVSSAVLNSTLSTEEYGDVYRGILKKEIKILYLAPETLLKDSVMGLLQQTDVSLFAVDEAHCISEWGHDFRPEYRMLRTLIDSFPAATLVGLTATATERVQADIAASMGLREPKVFISSFNRTNLFLEIVPKDKPLQQVLGFIGAFPDESGIIYCFSRKQVDQLTEKLIANGYNAMPYHAGLSDSIREQNQDMFIRDDVKIIVATVAFGMGINKPDVRFVIHYDLPQNIESYYQQIGRAGRDGLNAHCLLLFGYQDIAKIQFFIDQKEDKEKRIARDHLDALLALLESTACRRTPLLSYFGEEFAGDCGHCDNCKRPPKEVEDLTVEAQKLLSCVARTGERYGAGHVIDVLTGADTQRIRERGHDRLSTYGIGRERTKKQWQHLARQLQSRGYLNREDQFGSLVLTPKVMPLFKGQEKFTGSLPAPEKRTMTKHELDFDQIDSELFEKLRAKRKQLADDGGVPPYVVFSDKTLIEMCSIKPSSKISFLALSGAGPRKWEKYGEEFLEVLAGHGE